MTQENKRAPGYKTRQVSIKLNGKVTWVDHELAPLLKELNKAGLITRTHCSTHGSGHPWIVIRAGNIETVEVRNRGPYREVLIQWSTKKSEL